MSNGWNDALDGILKGTEYVVAGLQKNAQIKHLQSVRRQGQEAITKHYEQVQKYNDYVKLMTNIANTPAGEIPSETPQKEFVPDPTKTPEEQANDKFMFENQSVNAPAMGIGGQASQMQGRTAQIPTAPTVDDPITYYNQLSKIQNSLAGIEGGDQIAKSLNDYNSDLATIFAPEKPNYYIVTNNGISYAHDMNHPERKPIEHNVGGDMKDSASYTYVYQGADDDNGQPAYYRNIPILSNGVIVGNQQQRISFEEYIDKAKDMLKMQELGGFYKDGSSNSGTGGYKGSKGTSGEGTATDIFGDKTEGDISFIAKQLPTVLQNYYNEVIVNPDKGIIKKDNKNYQIIKDSFPSLTDEQIEAYARGFMNKNRTYKKVAENTAKDIFTQMKVMQLPMSNSMKNNLGTAREQDLVPVERAGQFIKDQMKNWGRQLTAQEWADEIGNKHGSRYTVYEKQLMADALKDNYGIIIDVK